MTQVSHITIAPRPFLLLRHLVPTKFIEAKLYFFPGRTILWSVIWLAVAGVFSVVRAETFGVKLSYQYFPANIGGQNYNLESMLYQPDDTRRHPLVILSHGRNGKESPYDARTINQLEGIARALAREGYVVAYIVRRGYGNSDGPDSELKDTAVLSGLEGAQDYRAAVEYWRRKDFVLPDKVVLMGHSQGGWVSLACTNVPMEGVLGVVNISGGTNYRLMGSGNIHIPGAETDAVHDHFVVACEELGRRSLIPSFWIYSENDLSIPGPTALRMFHAFTDAGGEATMLMLPPLDADGHFIVRYPNLFMSPLNEYFTAIGFEDRPDAPPVFDSMTGGEALSMGGTAVLTAAVTGYPPPLLQWRKNGLNLTNGGRTSGVTRTDLRITNLQTSDAGTYTLVAANALGTAVSPPIIVELPLSAPGILTQTQDQTVTSGQSALFSVAVTGNPAPDYQWQRRPAGSSTWANLAAGGGYSGTTSTTLSISPATTAMSGDQFRCVSSNSGGSITSNAALFTVIAPPVTPASPPSSGGGGGGAIAPWFIVVLALVAGARWIRSLKASAEIVGPLT